MSRNLFNTVALNKVQSSRFDLSHDVKLSCRMGQLVPTAVIECMPGDKFYIGVENMLRFMPLVSPVMHSIKVTTHFFFVPNRILWPEWEKWITGESDVEAPYVPISNLGPVDPGTVMDYLGYPTNVGLPAPLNVSPLPIAAYYKIYDEYYRDQNLIPEVFVPLVPGDNSAYAVQGEPLLQRAWQHDYFTACLPFAQKGDAVQIPLVSETSIPVEFNQLADAGAGIPKVRNPYNSTLYDGLGLETGSAPTQQGEFHAEGSRAAYDPDGSLVVDVQAGATDINTLRRAFRLQEWLERNARGGTRYVESILAHFGVRSSDARLQRPEYLGGSKQRMVISEVLATADDDVTGTPVGQMAGHGISVGGNTGIWHYCEEHGWIIGIMNIQPDTAYSQGLHRSLFRFDRLDYPWPSFAHIGEQEVYVKELYTNTADTEETFGYIPRYAEMRYIPSRVCSEMRTTLAHWHLGREFSSKPVLNREFIECVPRTDIFSFTEGVDTIVAHVFNRIIVSRKLPRYGIPSL